MILLVGGIPGTGKTSLIQGVRKFLSETDSPFIMKDGLIDYEFYPNHKLEIWGMYAIENIFAGTDRLSMAAQKDVIPHLANNENKIIIEGDRFCNSKFLDSVKDVKLIILDASIGAIQKRFIQRGSKQSPTFLKSRKTKIENIKKNYDHIVYLNETPEDLKENVNRILSFIHNDL